MKQTITVFLFLLPFVITAQSIMVSDDIHLRNDVGYELIGQLKGQTLLFRDKTTDFEIQAFDNRMRESWTKELEFDRKSPKVLGVSGAKEDFTIFYKFRKKSHTILKAHKYDPGANLKDSVTLKDFGYLFFSPNFEMIRSEDKSKILLYYLDKQTTIKAYAIDVDSLELMWEKEIKPEKFNFGRDFHQIILDNDGNMKMILFKDNFRSNRKQHYYEIHEYYGNTDLYRFYNIPMQGKLTFDVFFTADNLNNRLVAAGLYSDKNLSRTNGYFYLSIDPNDYKNHLLKFEPFELKFLSELIGKKVTKNKGVNELRVQETVLRRDGGVLMIAERTRYLERRSAGTTRVYYDPSLRYIVDYYFDELVVISIHPSGKTHWKNILRKKQYSQDDDGIYSSYFLFKSPSALRFLFNDEIRYENTVSEYVLNGIGDFDRNSILSTENMQLRLRFRDAIQVASNEIIVPSERRNRLKLVKMEY